MKQFMAALCLLFTSLALQATTAEQVMVSEGYVRGLPPSASNTAAYMQIHNHGEDTVVLVGARTPAAFFAEIHSTSREGEVMVMRHLPTLPIAPGQTAVLESGANHLMLLGLRGPLSDGDMVELTLEFQGGLEKTISLPVRSVVNESAPAGGAHQHH